MRRLRTSGAQAGLKTRLYVRVVRPEGRHAGSPKPEAGSRSYRFSALVTRETTSALISTFIRSFAFPM